MAKDKRKNTFGTVMGAICGILIGGYIVVLATASNYSPYKNNYDGKTFLRYINRNEFNILESEYKHGNNNVGKGKIIVENIE